jgi:hypothetical protein
MRFDRLFAIACLSMALTWSSPIAAQEVAATDAAAAAAIAVTPALPGQTTDDADWKDPWASRPVCAARFLKSDWQLTGKQRACNWIQNGVLSTSGMLAAVWSAEFSLITNPASERGDGFPVRFGRKFAQSGIRSTAAYIGTVIAHEDPREFPPYLALVSDPPPRGFFNRTAHALGRNVISSQCVGQCVSQADIHKRFVLSKLLGAAASGVAGEVLTGEKPGAHDRMVRGFATAYASTFVNQLFVEFKPELSAAGGRLFRLMGGR